MNALAQNIAEKKTTLEASCFQFGENFHYGKVYFSSVDNEYVTLENFLEDKFEYFINNNGDICAVPEQTSEIS